MYGVIASLLVLSVTTYHIYHGMCPVCYHMMRSCPLCYHLQHITVCVPYVITSLLVLSVTTYHGISSACYRVPPCPLCYHISRYVSRMLSRHSLSSLLPHITVCVPHVITSYIVLSTTTYHVCVPRVIASLLVLSVTAWSTIVRRDAWWISCTIACRILIGFFVDIWLLTICTENIYIYTEIKSCT